MTIYVNVVPLTLVNPLYSGLIAACNALHPPGDRDQSGAFYWDAYAGSEADVENGEQVQNCCSASPGAEDRDDGERDKLNHSIFARFSGVGVDFMWPCRRVLFRGPSTAAPCQACITLIRHTMTVTAIHIVTPLWPNPPPCSEKSPHDAICIDSQEHRDQGCAFCWNPYAGPKADDENSEPVRNC